MVENANCPKDQQYMVVKTASYRGLAAGKICGQNYDYSCEVDVTCVVKRECDRQHECQMTVDERVFLDYADACPGLTKYLYFEYQCVDTPGVHLCAPSGPPLNIRTTSRSTSSLTFVWDPPKQRKENGVILSYTACASESEDGPCFQTFVRATRKWDVRNLNASTKYYIRVLASNEGGDGNYSESKGFLTNGKATMGATANTASTLAFSLEIPSKTFLYLYVVALKLKEGEEIESSSTYEDNELVTYAEAIKSRHPIPYIAAVILFSGVNDNNFILGDGSNTSDATTERGFAKTGYYNGPLEPGSSYSIFLRIFLGDKEDYYSTDWSASSKTSEYAGGPRVLLNMSNGKVTAKQGDLVNLLCSVQGEPPITFQWEKDKKALDSFFESHESISSSFLVVPVKDQTGFGKYICHIRDRFHTANHTIWINKLESTSTVCTDVVSGEENTKVNLVGITVLAVLLTISLIVHACFAHQYRRLKLASANASLENENKDRNSQDCKNREKNDENYEPVVVGASPYTVPEITGDGEYDDHVYSHLNEVQNDYENQKETGM
ncbi:uncharacterized protein LOC114528043 [Dendronephthya gigantea]|uniref:uncharacterized protein LOC114528043 n=1 Tax=Dendronephthya gigantea TaxID=151771 RepID=UPI00106D18F6|nr:uncharacterized protein LOC114528043 [Dendronephthya gigantea]